MRLSEFILVLLAHKKLSANSLRPRKKTQKYASNFDLKKPGKSGTITRAAFPPFLPTTNILRFPPCLQQNISSIHITCLANLASGDERVQQISDIVMKTLRVLLGTGFIGLASGHGNIVQPPAWFHRCADNIRLFFLFDQKSIINQIVLS